LTYGSHLQRREEGELEAEAEAVSMAYEVMVVGLQEFWAANGEVGEVVDVERGPE
jgi:hypothetical protein